MKEKSKHVDVLRDGWRCAEIHGGGKMTFREFKYTANEEEPDCMLCENIHQDEEDENGDDYCYAHCGPEHFWNGYMRWEEVRS